MDSLNREKLETLYGMLCDDVMKPPDQTHIFNRSEALEYINKLGKDLIEDDKVSNELIKIRLEDSRADEEFEHKVKFAWYDRALELCKSLAGPLVVSTVSHLLTFWMNTRLQDRSFDFETNNSYTAKASRESWRYIQPK